MAQVRSSELKYETTIGDLHILQTYMSRRVLVEHRRDYLVALGGVILCAVFLTAVIVVNASPTLFIGRAMSASSTISYLVLIALLLTAALLALIPLARLRLRGLTMQVSPSGPLVGTTCLNINPEGLTIERSLMKTTYGWGAFKSVVVEKGAVILAIDTGMGVIIPSSAFRSDSERFEFAGEVSKQLEAAKRALNP